MGTLNRPSAVVPAEPDLVAVLDALCIPWTVDRPPNGTEGTIHVTLNHANDGRLERLIDALAGLRWAYEPGRELQFALWLEA